MMMKESDETSGSPRIIVVQDWFEELRQRVPVN